MNIKKIIDDKIDEMIESKDIVERTEKIQKKLFGLKEEPVKLSKIFEKIRESYLPEDDYENQNNYDMWFPLYFENSTTNDWYDIGYQKDELSSRKDGNDAYDYDNRITLSKKYGTENYYILSLVIEGVGYDIEQNLLSKKKLLSKIACLNEIERLLLNAHIKKREIILDVTSAEEIDTSLWEEN